MNGKKCFRGVYSLCVGVVFCFAAFTAKSQYNIAINDIFYINATDTIIQTICHGKKTGPISITLMDQAGGVPVTANFTISQSIEKTYFNQAEVIFPEGLKAGEYKITAFKDNGNNSMDDFYLNLIIQEVAPISVELGNITKPNCHLYNGGINLNVYDYQGSSYYYEWSNGKNGIINNSNPFIDSIKSGFYHLEVVDSAGCLAGFGYFLEDTTSISITTTNLQNVSCPGAGDGSITIEVASTNDIDRIIWSNGKIQSNTNTSTIGQLKAGNYQAIAIDQNGCKKSQSFAITQPDDFWVFFSENTGITSCGGTDTITCAVEGGPNGLYSSNNEYTFNWSANILPANTLDNTAWGEAGFYQVTITSTGADACQVVKRHYLKPFGYENFQVGYNPGDCGNALGSSTIDIQFPGFFTSNPNNYVGIEIRKFPNPSVIASDTFPLAGLGSNNTYTFSQHNNGTIGFAPGLYTVKVNPLFSLLANLPCMDQSITYPLKIESRLDSSATPCMVYVENGNNILMWKDPMLPIAFENHLSHYNIYRLNLGSNYQKIAEIPYQDTLRYFIDSNALGNMMASWYKLGLVDNCGSEKIIDIGHRTMQLEVSMSTDSMPILKWNYYVSQNSNHTLDKAIIMRGNGQNFAPIDSVPWQAGTSIGMVGDTALADSIRAHNLSFDGLNNLYYYIYYQPDEQCTYLKTTCCNPDEIRSDVEPINFPTQFFVASQSQQASGSEVCDGSINLEAFGGTPPYTYLWTHTASNTATLSGLCPGSYTVTVSDYSGNYSQSKTIVLSYDGVGLSPTVFFEKIKLYPNPSQGELTLQVPPALMGSQVLLYNTYGQMLSTQSLSATTHTMDISTFSPGLYILKIQNKEGFLHQRFIKK